MDLLVKIRKFLNRTIFQICSLILVVMVIDVTWQVVSRYVLTTPASFTDELARFLMIWLGLLGGTLLFGRNGHLAVTYFSDKCPENLKLHLSLFIYTLISLFVSFSMIYGGFFLVKRTLLQPSPAMHVSMGYVYSILPFSGTLILIFIALNIVDLLKGKK